MGCGRETQNIFFYLKKSKYDNKRNWNKIWYLIRHFNKLTYEDTIMPIICKIKGHKAFLPDSWEPNEWACKRCHSYIRNYNPRKEKLKKINKINAKYK